MAYIVYNGKLVQANSKYAVHIVATDPAFDIGTGFNDYLSRDSLVIVTNSPEKLYLLGEFTSYNGGSVPNIVSLNSDGTVNETFNPGTGISPAIISSFHF